MLKFRPIAPKPAAMAAPAPVPAAAKVRKRKAVAAGKRGRKPKKAAATVPPTTTTQMVDAVHKDQAEKEKDKSSSSRSSSSSGMTSVDSSPPPPPATTLPLMPVPPVEVAAAAPVPDILGVGHVPVARQASLVTVEDVTATWRDGGEGPPPPPAAGVLVDGDAAAPAFVSDRWGRVTWANAAFGRAVSAGAGEDDDEVPMVVLGAKDDKAVPAWGTCAGFSCRVRVRRVRGGGASSSLVAPCDVWRLDAAGGYLWRLDLQATLTLSLGGLL